MTLPRIPLTWLRERHDTAFAFGPGVNSGENDRAEALLAHQAPAIRGRNL